MAEALAAVKQDLGKDAVILHTRSYKQGGVFGFGAKAVVEITASDDPRALAPRDLRARAKAVGEAAPPRPPAPPTTVAPAVGASRAPAQVARAYGVPSPSLTPRPDPAPAQPPAEVLPVASSRAPRGSPAAEMASRVLQPASPDASAPAALRDELAAIRRMVGQVLQAQARGTGGAEGLPPPAPAMPDALLKHYCRLIENEVARELADQLVAEVRDELSPAELGDEGIVRTTVLRKLESLIPVEPGAAAPPRPEGGRPLTIALVGPTGVGKTTTIAKLAAAYKLRHGKRVGLITSDTYRIAAVDQLRTYANIIGVPLKVVLTPDEMAQACESLGAMDVILIDTAGRSPGDSERLEELRSFVHAARPHQTHLVLSSVLSEASLVRTVERFAVLEPSQVIFTKLDEAANFGVLVSVARRLSARLSYVTTGQEVPDDIEPGRADRLARLVLDGQNPAPAQRATLAPV
jgi:flagellar biosynthesis protein FlhF